MDSLPASVPLMDSSAKELKRKLLSASSSFLLSLTPPHPRFFLSSSALLLSSFASFLFLFPFFSSLLLLSLPFLPPLLFLSSFLFSLFLSLLFYRPLLVLSSPLPYSPSSSSSPSSAPSSFLIPSPSPLPLPFHLSISSLPLPTTSSFTLLLPHSFLASSDPFLLNASHLFLPVRDPPPGLSHLWLQQEEGNRTVHHLEGPAENVPAALREAEGRRNALAKVQGDTRLHITQLRPGRLPSHRQVRFHS